MSRIFSIDRRIISISLALFCLPFGAMAQRTELLPFGDFNSWIIRDIKESAIIGGNEKRLYEIGPNAVIQGNIPYVPDRSTPWATSNVYAKVSGVSKGSNAVYPYKRSENNMAVKLCSQLESVKALELINMDVMVAGSLFLGRMFEPISSTKKPYTKMEVGIPFTGRPDAFVLDYKIDLPSIDTRTRSTGFGKKQILPGRDTPVVFILLQRRWEDAAGNIHAARVATGGEIFKKATDWVNGHEIPLFYGNCSAQAGYEWLGLRNGDRAYYARNSKGKLVPVMEETWDSPDAVPTHAVVMISSGNGDPYIATPGTTLYVDNAGFKYK